MSNQAVDHFLEAIDDRQGVTLLLGGNTVFIARCRLGLHLQLARIEQKILDCVSAVEMAADIVCYLGLAGVSDVGALPAIEQLEAFIELRRLNNWQWLLPWLKAPPSHMPEMLPYEYGGRQWAIWIHKIASRYGWSRDQILNLWPEEAAAYVQEILTSEYQEMEDRRALSEVSYRYDSNTKISKFVNSPKPNWMVDLSLPKPIRIHRSMLPVGNIVSLADVDDKDLQ